MTLHAEQNGHTTIPSTQAAALGELLRINRCLAFSGTRVNPDLADQGRRSADLIGLLDQPHCTEEPK